jgi:ribosomal protein S18 acetylase RimI-like enzyme
MPEIEIRVLDTSPGILLTLSELLVETVAHGGSVSFMHPLPQEKARAFWQGSLGSAERGERIILGAFDGKQLVGTVTLSFDVAQNQPHRAEIAKMMTRISHRGRGIATALMRSAEKMALEHGRTLLVLDTATDGGASGLYERVGFNLTGEIPDYALKPHGGLSGAKIYWKRLGTAAPR